VSLHGGNKPLQSRKTDAELRQNPKKVTAEKIRGTRERIFQQPRKPWEK
jgi:hypothetical protein